MASWLMRIVLSSWKSIGKRRAICSGLQALAFADPLACMPAALPRKSGTRNGSATRVVTTPASGCSTNVRKVLLSASLSVWVDRSDRSACHWAVDARYSRPPLRVAALRRSSWEIFKADRPSRHPISRLERP